MFSVVEKSFNEAPEVRAATPGPRSAPQVALGRSAQMMRTATSAPRAEPGNAVAFDPAAWKPKNPRLAQVAAQIHALRRRGRATSRCPSGLAPLDTALGGGFLTGAVHELVAAKEGTAAYSVALWTAARAAGRHKWIIYVDTRGDLYPPGVAQLRVPLGRLLVLRVTRPADALWTCEQTLRCRAVAAVLVPLPTIDARSSRRLQLAAEAGGNLGLLIRSDERGGQTFAASRLRCEPLVGGNNRRMLITLLKIREGQPREPFVVELPDAADSVSSYAVPVDRTSATQRCVGQ